jgi:beta-lactamase class A
MWARVLATCFALGVGTAAALASPASPLSRQLAMLPRIDAAGWASLGGDPESMQRRYDAARDLAESTRRAVLPKGCDRLQDALTALAEAEIAVTEAYDRLRPWRAAQRHAEAVRRRVEGIRPLCSSGGVTAASDAVPALSLPGPSEVFFGRVAGPAPARSTRVLINVNGARAATAPVRGGRFSVRATVRSGPALVEALFLNAAGEQVGAAVSRDAFALPPAATKAPAKPRHDRALSARLAAAGRGFDGYSSVRLERLGTGTVAEWNGAARFPAASTVKLVVMIEAARRHGLGPASPVLYDVRKAARWSSNLAANRLFGIVGRGDAARGRAVAERRLRSLGATSSTYPGEYRVGTSSNAGMSQPPLATTRVTTARDLASIMRAIHLAATGRRAGLDATGLRPATARALLRALLDSDSRGHNVGLVKPYLPARTAVAQKNGWLSDSRSTAAIVYDENGPAILVVLTFRSGGLGLAQAESLGADAIRIALTGSRRP